MLVLLAIQPPPPLSSSHMVVPVVLMICREVTMSSLREWAAAAGEAAHKVRAGGVWGGMGLCLWSEQVVEQFKGLPGRWYGMQCASV
jgi:phosphatidylglycerophosphate synthase